MKIKKLLSNIKHRLFHKKEEWDFVEVNGKTIKCIKNSFRKTKDTDDDWFNSLAKNATVIFDIGCNIGYTALLGLTNENVKKMLLVDPNPEALFIAHKNLIANNLIGKTSTFVSFVSDLNDKEVDFYTIGHGAAGSIYKSHAETAASLNSFIKVKTVTLDFLSSYFELIPDFIKIDVEGAEFQVLEGAKETVLKSKCKILVEMHSNQDLTMFENANNLLKWCKEVEYNAWYLTNKEILVTPEIIKKRGRCHVLLLPKNNFFPSYLN